MLLQSWMADSTLFDGDIMAGPVPSLFSEDPEASLAGAQEVPLGPDEDLPPSLHA